MKVLSVSMTRQFYWHPKRNYCHAPKAPLRLEGMVACAVKPLHAPIRLTAGDMFSCTDPQSFRSKIDIHVAKTL
jgi:hypothetical protein